MVKHRDEKIILLLFFVMGCVMSLSTELNHLDSNFHLDYVREIQETHSIPKYHPHIFNTEGSKVPFPYPVGYHLSMAVFPHWVPLYKILQVVFATLCLVLTLKIADLLGISRTPSILFSLIFAYSFSRFSLTPHPDMLAMLLMLISFYFTLRYLQKGRSVDGLVAVLFGFYGAMVRELALITLLFAFLFLLLRYEEKRRIMWVLFSIVLFTGFGYYWINCHIKGQNILYPFVESVDAKASDWFISHVSFWSLLGYKPIEALKEFLEAMIPIFPIMLFVKPKGRLLAVVFGMQVIFTFVFLPSITGLKRYVMFTLPFLAIAYANFWEKFPKRALVVLFVGMIFLYSTQAYSIDKEISPELEEVGKNLTKDDSVLFRQYGQLAYRVNCKANWVSLFWCGDLFDTFENVDKVENFFEAHKINYVLIDKMMIVGNEMIGSDAEKYPKRWVEKIDSIGFKICETRRYALYRVG